MKEEIEEQIDRLYASGELTISKLKKIKNKFTLACKFCKSEDIAIIVKQDDDGCCETCSSPYALATIKCKQCGQGISIRD